MPFAENPYAPTEVLSPRLDPKPVEGDTLVFYARTLPPWLVSAGLLCAVVYLVNLLGGDDPLDGAELMNVLATGLAASAAAMWWIVRRYPIELRAEGLRCVDFWHRYQFVRWAEIDQVKPIWFLGLRYVRVHSSQLRRPIWLPLFLRDAPRFWMAVARWAGPQAKLLALESQRRGGKNSSKRSAAAGAESGAARMGEPPFRGA